MISVTATSDLAHAPVPSRATKAIASLLLVSSAIGTAACRQRVNAEAAPTPAETSTDTLFAQPGSDDASAALEQGDSALRRGYGIVDMRYDPCVTTKSDHRLTGEGCASGFVIYGPYVSIPANSEIEVTFDVQPSQRVEVYADMVSQMGKQALAGLNPLTVEAGVTQRLGYRVHVSNADQFVESRIGVRSATPATFTISNYTMTVH